MSKFLILLLILLSTSYAYAIGGAEAVVSDTAPPLQASSVGYLTNTFNSKFSNDIDLTNSKATGFKWYLWGFFSTLADSSKISVTSNGVVLNGDITGPGGEITSAVATGDGNIYAGSAFGGGGYFEATLKFNPALLPNPNTTNSSTAAGNNILHFSSVPSNIIAGQYVTDSTSSNVIPAGTKVLSTTTTTITLTSNVTGTGVGNGDTISFNGGWPAWWALAYAGTISPTPDQWSGQAAGYRHNVETDFMEYLSTTTPASYGGTLHDWYGIYNVTCGAGLCQVASQNNNRIPPPIQDLTQFHKYGFLWVPATVSTSGYAKFYFDDIQLGNTITWTQFTNQSPPPTSSTSWTFGILDYQQLVLILGTGPGQPMTVKSVKVWQTNTSSNLHR